MGKNTDATERTWQQALGGANGLTLGARTIHGSPECQRTGESPSFRPGKHRSTRLNGQGFSNLQSDDYSTCDTWAKA